MVKIVFTKHALKKFDDLSELKIKLTKEVILNILSKPNNIDASSDYPSTIASGNLDKNHSLRVVYRKERAKRT